MAKRKKLTLIDLIGISYIGSTLLHFFIAGFFPTNTKIGELNFAFSYMTLFFMTFLFSITAFIFILSMFKKHKKNQLIIVSNKFKMALILWVFELIFQTIIFAASFANIDNNIFNILILILSSNDDLNNLYMTQILLTSLLLVSASITIGTILVISKTYNFVFDNDQLDWMNWTSVKQFSFALNKAFTIGTEQDENATTNLIVVDFNLGQNSIQPMLNNELNVFALKSLKLKTAKKGLTPPDSLLSF